MATQRISADQEEAEIWARWLAHYGATKLYAALLDTCQNARGTCVNCGQSIYLDIEIGGGVPDWYTDDGDFGCHDSPDTTYEGTGSHVPEKRRGGTPK